MQEKHQSDECPHRMVKCVNRCEPGAKWRACDMEAHLRESCPCRIVDCGYGCGAAMMARDLARHMSDVCELTPVICPLDCNTAGLCRKDLDTHCSHLCPRRYADVAQCCRAMCAVHRIVACELGCGVTDLEFKDIASHMLTCPYRVIKCDLPHNPWVEQCHPCTSP